MANRHKSKRKLTSEEFQDTNKKRKAARDEETSSSSDDESDDESLATGPPGKPTVTSKSRNSIEVEWTKPTQVMHRVKIKSYILKVYDGKRMNEEKLPKKVMNATVPIKPNVVYTLKVVADCGKYGKGEESEETVFPPPPTLLEKVIKNSTLNTVENSLKVYALKVKELSNSTTSNTKKCELDFNTSVPHGQTNKVIMVVGATGSGKTTLINGMINYILGVKWEDDVRFKLVVEPPGSQAKSQTSWITAYTIHHHEGFRVPYSVTIIDTPGFGDTEGIERDKQITEQIGHFFNIPDGSGIDHIDAVGFVVQSSLARLTHTQRYVFDSILALFGKDIEENIFMLLTFADASEPAVLDGLAEAGLPQNRSYKFNNSAILMSNKKGNSNKKIEIFFGDLGFESFQHFFDSVNKAKTKSLILTKGVLHERQQIEAFVKAIEFDTKLGLNTLETLTVQSTELQKCIDEKLSTQDYKCTVPREIITTKKVENGTYTTNCLTCNRTCHDACAYKDNEEKKNCCAMGEDENCTSCKHHWSLHNNQPFVYIITTVLEEQTYEELKLRYFAADDAEATAQSVLQEMSKEFIQIQVKVISNINSTRKSVERLQQIALKPNPLSEIEYIDLMIESEKAEKRPGFNKRISQLQKVREHAVIMVDIARKNSQPFDGYLKQLAVQMKQDVLGTIRKYVPFMRN